MCHAQPVRRKADRLVEALPKVLDAALRHLSPRSDMAKALAYGTKRWPALSRFLGDSRLPVPRCAQIEVSFSESLAR